MRIEQLIERICFVRSESDFKTIITPFHNELEAKAVEKKKKQLLLRTSLGLKLKRYYNLEKFELEE